MWNKAVVKLSNLERIVEIILKNDKIEYEREYRFHPKRRFRLDFAFPEYKIGIEIQGGIWLNGYHNRGQGQNNDAEKNNLAVLDGWKILYYTTNMINKDPGQVINDIKGLINEN